MRGLPPLDAHAHIRVDLEASEIATLDGVVLAATRSLEEADTAVRRTDPQVIWGVGVHPGLVGVQRAFTVDRFETLIQLTPLVSEVGLDGTSRVDPELQRATFRAVLKSLRTTPRIVSVHSYGATSEVLDIIEEQDSRGIILHWWLGDPAETQRALELGCHFSINSTARSLALINQVPASRLLAETDHPFGDRKSRAAARPGNVADVERSIAKVSGADITATRLRLWRNLRDIAIDTQTLDLFPRAARLQFAAV